MDTEAKNKVLDQYMDSLSPEVVDSIINGYYAVCGHIGLVPLTGWDSADVYDIFNAALRRADRMKEDGGVRNEDRE